RDRAARGAIARAGVALIRRADDGGARTGAGRTACVGVGAGVAVVARGADVHDLAAGGAAVAVHGVAVVALLAGLENGAGAGVLALSGGVGHVDARDLGAGQAAIVERELVEP